MPLEQTIDDTQKIKVTLAPMTGGPHPVPAPVDGIPSWEVLSGNSTVEAAEDGMSAFLISADEPDEDPAGTRFKVTADANLGAGIEPISDTIQLHVVAVRAQNVGLTIGTPEPK